MLRRFIEVNTEISSWFESFFCFSRDDARLLRKLFSQVDVNSRVADVGGGKACKSDAGPAEYCSPFI